MIEGVRNSKNDPLIGQVVQIAHSDSTDDHLYCDGNTIGKDGSGATYEGEEYRVLFNKIKSLWTNAGTEDFDTGDTVKLPDLRGAFLRGDGTNGGSLGTGPNVGVAQPQGTAKNGLNVNEPQHRHYRNYLNAAEHNMVPVSSGGPGGGLGLTAGASHPVNSTYTQYTTIGVSLTGGDSETRPANAGIKNYIRFM